MIFATHHVSQVQLSNLIKLLDVDLFATVYHHFLPLPFSMTYI